MEVSNFASSFYQPYNSLDTNDSMLAFLVAMSYVFLNGTADWITRGIMITILLLMALITGGVLHADWGSIAPSPDSLPRRTKQNIVSAGRKFGEFVRAIPIRGFMGTSGSSKYASANSNSAPLLPISHNASPAQQR